MPKIKWKVGAKVQTKAVGLEGAPYYSAVGDEIEVSAKALEAMKKLYGPDAFSVVEAPKAATAAKKEK